MGAVNPLPARMICGRQRRAVHRPLINVTIRNSGKGLSGASEICTFSGFWAAEPLGPITLTSAYLDSSSAMCQFSRSMPPTRGGRLRVMMSMRRRGVSKCAFALYLCCTDRVICLALWHAQCDSHIVRQTCRKTGGEVLVVSKYNGSI